MSQAHCRRFPECMNLGENHFVPKCDKPGCPGNIQWPQIIGGMIERDFKVAYISMKERALNAEERIRELQRKLEDVK